MRASTTMSKRLLRINILAIDICRIYNVAVSPTKKSKAKERETSQVPTTDLKAIHSPKKPTPSACVRVGAIAYAWMPNPSAHELKHLPLSSGMNSRPGYAWGPFAVFLLVWCSRTGLCDCLFFLLWLFWTRWVGRFWYRDSSRLRRVLLFRSSLAQYRPCSGALCDSTRYPATYWTRKGWICIHADIDWVCLFQISGHERENSIQPEASNL